jgi:hypothetical protein
MARTGKVRLLLSGVAVLVGSAVIAQAATAGAAHRGRIERAAAPPSSVAGTATPIRHIVVIF